MIFQATVAQMAEHLTRNEDVHGSNPCSGSIENLTKSQLTSFNKTGTGLSAHLFEVTLNGSTPDRSLIALGLLMDFL